MTAVGAPIFDVRTWLHSQAEGRSLYPHAYTCTAPLGTGGRVQDPTAWLHSLVSSTGGLHRALHRACPTLSLGLPPPVTGSRRIFILMKAPSDLPLGPPSHLASLLLGSNLQRPPSHPASLLPRPLQRPPCRPASLVPKHSLQLNRDRRAVQVRGYPA